MHVHTPGTLKNDNFEGRNPEEKWENFYNAISEYVEDGNDPLKAIAVIGVTDYLSIDNYLKVIADNKLPSSVKLILPNVEMRMGPVAKKSPVNIHCIFDPSVASELESRFFGKLIFKSGESSYSASHDELKRFGRDYKKDKTISDSEAYSLGRSQFVLELSAIKAVFENDHDLRDHCIIAVSNGTNDGVSGIVSNSDYFLNGNSQMDATRSTIYQFADMIFSANDSDIKYFLGESKDDKNKIVDKFGSLKPCIHGSDAHSIDNLFEPARKKYCWIKADPTFNGLRQALYEPNSRVKISPIKPETKSDYQVIDRVEIQNQDFSETPIYFNDKLTSIIGGKSTGKSLLLHNMALAIDKKQTEDKEKETQNASKSINDVTVYWKDGTISNVNNSSSPGHKIVYIPQTYLNRLSDEKEELTEIDKIIHEIVMLNEDAKKSYVEMNHKINELKENIGKNIFSLLQQHEDLKRKQNDLAEIGTKKGIEKEIEKLKLEKDKLSKDLSISDDEIRQYDDSNNQITVLSKKIDSIEKNIEIISNIDSLISAKNIDYHLTNELIQKIQNISKEAVKIADEMWIKEKEILLADQKQQLIELNGERNQKSNIVKELSGKISNNAAIKNLSDAIQKEEKKLLEFNEIESLANQSENKYKGLLKRVSNEFVNFKKYHMEYAEFINCHGSLSKEDLEFTAEAPFRQEAFVQEVQNNFDKRGSFTSYIDLKTFDEEWISADNVYKLIDAVVNEKIRLPKSKTIEIVLRSLLSDWYNCAYRVRMDNDLIDEMSPGKKALVLLKMLISLAESTCPILIDQPEDDLDNRSIFDELIPFIKKKKLSRQIIVVTHNANVVLGADSEEIIVANQKGKNSPNKSYRFEYRSGSIEDDMPENEECNDVLGKQGIQQHICDILEGGKSAFDLRKHKYRI